MSSYAVLSILYLRPFNSCVFKFSISSGPRLASPIQMRDEAELHVQDILMNVLSELLSEAADAVDSERYNC